MIEADAGGSNAPTLLGRREVLAGVLVSAALPARAVAATASGPLPAIDFSCAGYAAGLAEPPVVPVAASVCADAMADHTAMIQAAIDRVGALPLDANGLRGAVLLQAGNYRIAGRLRLNRSGVVLRGSPGAVLTATGIDRGARITIGAAHAPTPVGNPVEISASVAAGSDVLPIASSGALRPGDHVAVVRRGNAAWIAALGMDQAPGNFAADRLHWKPGSRDLVWHRRVVAIAGGGREVRLDAPITAALDPAFGGGTVTATNADTLPGRIGVEDLAIVSDFDARRSKDEDHAWIAVAVDNGCDLWVRGVTARHFAASAVRVHHHARRVLIEDVHNLAPVSEIGGYRRQAFVIEGQQVLVRRCSAEQGLNDFSTGLTAAGPNVFLDCSARDALGDSGGWESWSAGTLFENVALTGAGLRLAFDDERTQGGGWTAANSLIWNCSALRIIADRAPTAPNLTRVAPFSCYAEQLRRRRRAPLGLGPEPEAPSSAPLPGAGPELPVQIVNGRFVAGGRTVWGGALNDAWWRGQTNPITALDHGRSITRFVPGREGPGLTEDLPALAAEMASTGVRFHQGGPGLWYERRRDDHTMDRRPGGDVWAPFYELPWARSGEGQAWDGLSLYDLSRYNPWYFDRMRRFAQACAAHGHVLFHNLYNTHNVLEIVPHWADYSWRPANNVNDTGLPEPMPIEPNGRLNVANRFYSVDHPPLRALHRSYICHVLDQLGDRSNVFFSVAFQYAGPLAFQRFFLDTVAAWERQTNRRVRIALATSKGITDAILADRRYARQIAVIDMRYWQYRPDGELWAPRAGQNKAYREIIGARFGRIADAPPPTTAERAYAQVREYRARFPDKAVVAWHNGVGEVPALMAGAAQVLRRNPTAGHDQGRAADTTLLDGFLRDRLGGKLHTLDVAEGLFDAAGPTWCLADANRHLLLVASLAGASIGVRAGELRRRRWQATWFSPSTGKTLAAKTDWGDDGTIAKPDARDWLLLLQARPGACLASERPARLKRRTSCKVATNRIAALRGMSMSRLFRAAPLALALMLIGCGDGGDSTAGPIASVPTPTPTASPSPSPSPTPTATPTPAPTTTSVTQRTIATFDNPWAMVFLPDGRLLVTEKPGALQLVTQAGVKTAVTGVPTVTYSGQLGLQDVALDPDYATNGRIWLTYAEPATGGQRLAVARATLNLAGAPKLDALTVIWRATPATTGGQLGARLAFSPDGRYLFVTSGERQQGTPAQDLAGTLGKIVRINLDGTAAAGNPFATTAGAKPEIWTLGHRNPYGLVFASDGRLFESEMGPAGGDEFNLIEAGKNYGWPRVSEGDNYDGTPIPRHATNTSYTPPLFSWTPVIAPGGMIQYHGSRFVGWTGDFILAGLVQQGIVRVRVSGGAASEAARIALGARIREVEEAPNGAIWVLQDGGSAKLIELLPG